MDQQAERITAAETTGPGQRVWHALVSPYAAAVWAPFFWAASTIVVRYVRLEAPPMGLAFWRIVAALVIFLPFAIGPLRRQWPLARESLGMLALLALLLMVGGNAILFLALQYTIAINAGVINSVEPVFIVLLAWLLFRDPFGWRQAVGVAISLTGVLVLITTGSLARLAELELNLGDLLVTFAFLSWGLYAVLLRKLPRALDGRVALLGLLVFGGIFTLPLYLVESWVARPTPFTIEVVLAVLWLAVTSTILAVLMWNHAIARLGSGRAGLFLHLIPAFTVILAILLLGETFRLYHAAGIALIGAGIYLSTVRRG